MNRMEIRKIRKNELLNIFIQIIRDIVGISIKKLRIADLGCFEGFYSYQLALLGAIVVGIEGRKINIEKAMCNKSDNLIFYHDDVKNFNIDKYGHFDVILLPGILYHLDFNSICNLLEEVYKCCNRLLIIDTNCCDVLPSKYKDMLPATFNYKGINYSGMIYDEPIKGLSPTQIEKRLTSAISNDESFWFKEKELAKMLSAVGFGSVYKLMFPEAPTGIQRETFIAIK